MENTLNKGVILDVIDIYYCKRFLDIKKTKENKMAKETEVPLYDVAMAIGQADNGDNKEGLFKGLIKHIQEENGFANEPDAVSFLMSHIIIKTPGYEKTKKVFKEFAQDVSEEYSGFSLEELLGDETDGYIEEAFKGIKTSRNEQEGATYISGLLGRIAVASELKQEKLERGEDGASNSDEIQEAVQRQAGKVR
jgi:hypothetical protein